MSGSEEWQVGTILAANGTQREYIIHATPPRFKARIAKIDLVENRPAATEGEADITSGFVRQIDRTTILCEVDWTDEVAPGQHDQWLHSAAFALLVFRGFFLRWATLTPVVELAHRIGLNISDCRSWRDFRCAFRAQDVRSEGELQERMRDLVNEASSGEVSVLLSMLHAADNPGFADEIVFDETWRRLERTYGEHAEAVALAIRRR